MHDKNLSKKLSASLLILSILGTALPAWAQNSYANQRRMEAEQRRNTEHMLHHQHAHTPAQARYRVREEPDIAGELFAQRRVDMAARMQSVIAIAVHTESGAYGAAVGNGLASSTEAERHALSSCMAKVSGRPYTEILQARPRQIKQLLAETGCILFKVNPLMNSVSLFRTHLPGTQGYRFYQADSRGLVVESERHHEAKQRCESEGSDCQLLLQLGVGEHGQVF